eukprot:CAMPEP_0184391510 /NCGR_PEP_ID=MMETSP0007-20130409/14157_1 /TAXON_ID=97485 /ORGANISM="Prymnesium parvum, Strain Texoma1" /LENGTH=45 /DNA_ID= /DNA_START= /DNA_END= /DNA_ORIENTATION=
MEVAEWASDAGHAETNGTSFDALVATHAHAKKAPEMRLSFSGLES